MVELVLHLLPWSWLVVQDLVVNCIGQGMLHLLLVDLVVWFVPTVGLDGGLSPILIHFLTSKRALLTWVEVRVLAHGLRVVLLI